MIVSKSISFKRMMKWSGPQTLIIILLMAGVATLYHFKIIAFFIPWVPISVIGTAVAFYVGFKNNQAYSRMWEARKIWGGIINDSRSWGMMVDGFVSNQFATKQHTDEEIHEIKQRLIHRHIGWTYMHRMQLLQPTSWEHASQSGVIGKAAKYYQDNFGVGLLGEFSEGIELENFIDSKELERLLKHKNTATQIINEQSRDLKKLRELGLIEDFRHMEMVNLLKGFYTLQGKNERIKKFPLPRQYANASRYFVFIFIMLLPFSMMHEIMRASEWGIWISVPVTSLIAWVYLIMESVGDYSENPFQGMANDIPMLSLCRTIEIDLREMLNEKELPPAIQAKKDILM